MQIKLNDKHADYTEYKWNIREADNRIAVKISCRPEFDLWYISYEVLTDLGWEHVSGSAWGCGNKKLIAIQHAEEMYDNWKDSYVLKNFIRKKTIPSFNINKLLDLLNIENEEETKK